MRWNRRTLSARRFISLNSFKKLIDKNAKSWKQIGNFKMLPLT